MIDILDRINLYEILNKIQADDKPIFGMMTAQHMVEHLALVVRFSNGKLPQINHFPGKEEKIKSFLLDTEKEIPIGLKLPVLPIDKLIALNYSDLIFAINILKLELSDFDTYFANNPTALPIHPATGELTYKEWLIFHNNHFRHHFKQFGLLPH